MTVKREIDVKNTKNMSDKQRSMLKALETREIVFDDENPELTKKELAEFRQISDARRDERKKQTVTIRLSTQTLSKAKSLGKGYTSVLARILEMALNDNDMIRKCL